MTDERVLDPKWRTESCPVPGKAVVCVARRRKTGMETYRDVELLGQREVWLKVRVARSKPSNLGNQLSQAIQFTGLVTGPEFVNGWEGAFCDELSSGE